jgi:hypothetical protein
VCRAADVPGLTVDPFTLVRQQEGDNSGEVGGTPDSCGLRRRDEHVFEPCQLRLSLLCLSPHQTRHHAVAPNPFLAIVVGDMSGQLFDGGLRRVVRDMHRIDTQRSF